MTDQINDQASADTTVDITQQQTITVIFEESGLPDNVNWSVSVNNYTYSGTSPNSIEVTLPAGSYTWKANDVDINTGTGEYCYYYPTSSTQSGTVSSSTTVNIVYTLYKCVTV